MTRMMQQGGSWSGRERHCSFISLGDGRFVDASFVSGLDFVDDGRALAVFDWDGDGNLDLWLRNRTGPQLRLMKNGGRESGSFVAFRLEGKTSNRDAVGARIELRVSGTRRIKEVVAGDGYLSQSSRWVQFGLASGERIDEVVVSWPGAESEVLPGPAANGRYRLVQGTRRWIPVPGRNLAIDPAPAELEVSAPGQVVLLKEPIALPPTLSTLLPPTRSRATLVNLWAHWCEPCISELKGLVRDRRAGEETFDLVALSVDAAEDRPQARAVLEKIVGEDEIGTVFARSGFVDESELETVDAVLEHLLGTSGELALPTSLLVDPAGEVLMVYLGPVTSHRVAQDLKEHVSPATPASRRSLYPGRWYYRTPRDYAGLADALERRGRSTDADFYRALLGD